MDTGRSFQLLCPLIPQWIWLESLNRCQSDADRALGRLNGVASLLPNPDLFVAMYVRHEAVLSSQIEGTQSTLGDVLEYETGATPDTQPRGVEEVVNYVRVLNYGLERLDEFPLSLSFSWPVCWRPAGRRPRRRGGYWACGKRVVTGWAMVALHALPVRPSLTMITK